MGVRGLLVARCFDLQSYRHGKFHVVPELQLQLSLKQKKRYHGPLSTFLPSLQVRAILAISNDGAQDSTGKCYSAGECSVNG